MKIESCPVCGEIHFDELDYHRNPTQDNWHFDCFKDKTISRCKSCDFSFTAEAFDEGELSQYYNTLYSQSEPAKYFSHENYEFASRSLSHVNFIKTSIDLFNDMNILEIGPNENGMLPSFNLFCRPNFFYFEQLEFPVINHFGGKRLGNYFNKEAACSLNEDKKMDLITLSHVFEHLDPLSLNESIEAMKIALNSHGYISIEVPIESTKDMQAPHTVFFNVENMSILFKKHGFKIVATQNIEGQSYDISNSVIENNTSPRSSIINFFKKIFSIIPRKLRVLVLKPIYQKRLQTLYDGRPYLRLLVQKSV